MQVIIAPAAATVIPKEYASVLIGVIMICLQYVLTVMLFTMGARVTVYRRTFMRQFDDIHRFAFPNQPKAPSLGYPDCGNGYFSKKLGYADWFKMNCG